ncbi:hypothetical protein ABIA35_005767 [Catenulispora sp. MAP12-49]|uniref:D-alanyl-D-alanine carboxypeptidase family protein n=1 Tax=unclassified Catenulispora TaxID=414885 RepID=UPI0035167CB7
MEQRDQTPQEPAAEDIGEDIGRAAAEAAARAGEYGPGADSGHGYGSEEPAGRKPRRWLVVGGVAVAALAVAGTATAIAGRSHTPRNDTALNAAAASTEQSPTLPPTTPQSTAGTDGTTTGGTTAPTTPGTSPTPGTRPSTPKTPATSPKSSPSTTGAPTEAGDGENGDCENTSHDTAADEAVKFSGMTRGTQAAFLSAQKDAKAAGLGFVLNSGYRSAAYQQRVFDCWVKQLGSPQAARQYALPPNESAHVQGYAMDIAPPSAASWLEASQGKYGLCRRYADETWHFEYQARYKTQGCPALLPHP